MNEELIYVYAHPKSRSAWPQIGAAVDPNGNLVLLFTCPEAWIPQTKEEFVRACEYHGHKQTELLDWNPDLVPF